LIRHLQRGWSFLRTERNESFDLLPAMQHQSGAGWYAGTADAVFQNMDIITRHDPEHVIVLAGDHVYKMDFTVMLHHHAESGAEVTIGCLDMPRGEASSFGVIAVDESERITDFLEKPRDPPGIPGAPDRTLVSMGIYVFSTAFLLDQLRADAGDTRSSHDFGADLIPAIVGKGRAAAHRFAHSCVRSDAEAETYWRDVGTLNAYWEANIDLTSAAPALDLYDSTWPIWTHTEVTPPAKFVRDEEGRRGMAIDSMISGGCIISGASLRRSLLFTGVRVQSQAELQGAVVLPHASIGRGARLANVVIDRGVNIPKGVVVGVSWSWLVGQVGSEVKVYSGC
jgi:glucose-1-phosphate adenylyltransferase